MRASLKVGRIFGVPIYLHYSLALIMVLLAYAFGAGTGALLGFPLGYGDLDIGLAGQLALGIMAAVIFFASVLVHELAHTYLALRRGYAISGITLFIFGGVSEIEKAPDRAVGEGLMSLVGPLSSLAIGAFFTPLYLLVEGLSDGVALEALAITLSITAFYNLLLGAFNLLPAFPMDGGRVLRASLVKRLGFLRATEVAVMVGRVMAIALVVLGVFYNFWLILIALFIFLGASQELQATRVREALRGVKVRDIMSQQVSTVVPEDTVGAVQGKMMAERHTGYPVMEGGRPVGMVSLEGISQVPEQARGSVPVREVMSRVVPVIRPEAEAFEALEEMAKKKISKLLVMDQGLMVGIVTRQDIVKAVEMMRQSDRARGSFLSLGRGPGP